MIVLVRHGRTAANAGGLLLGRLDPGLDAEGVTQAERLGVACAALDVARVVTSPLARCRQTADAVVAAAGGGVVAEPDERWIELDYGELDGRPLAEIPAATWAMWRDDVAWSPPGGESIAGLGARVRAACTGLLDDARDRDVVVVTHVSPIKAAVAWALGVGDEVAWRMWVAPASLTRIGVAGDAASLRSFNELAHLT
ncbi:MAG TPA: histidine phosphatase family protein [Acidimicrobiales bacterium]|nr:histidine phosphatase family protein [Acidimicrobiales bacterium]